jgi:hypothetical protein
MQISQVFLETFDYPDQLTHQNDYFVIVNQQLY